MPELEAGDHSTLGLTAQDRMVVLVGFPLAGAAIGAALPLVWRLVEDVGWIPFHGPLSALMSLDEGWHSLLRVGLLALAGLLFALATLHEDTVVTVGDDALTIAAKGTSRTYAREQVAAVHHDGKHLVIETVEGRRLLDAPVENSRKRGAEIFGRHGYPWEND